MLNFLLSLSSNKQKVAEAIAGIKSGKTSSFPDKKSELHSNVDVALCFVEKHPQKYRTLPIKLLKNEDIARVALKRDPKNIQFTLTKNTDILWKTLEAHPERYSSLTRELPTPEFRDKAFLYCFKADPTILNDSSVISTMVVDSFICAEKILETHPSFFQHLSVKLRNDKHIAKIAIENYGRNYGYVGNKLKNNVLLAKIAIKKEPVMIAHMTNWIQDHLSDNEIKSAMYALCETKEAYVLKSRIKDLSSNILNNFEYCEILLRNIKVRFSVLAENCVNSNIRDNTELVQVAVQREHLELAGASERLQNNPETCLLAIKANYKAYITVPNRLHQDPAFVQEAIEANGGVYQYLPALLKQEMSILQSAMVTYPKALDYAPLKFKEDVNLQATYFHDDPLSFSDFMVDLMNHKPEILIDLKRLLKEQFLSEPLRFVSTLTAIDKVIPDEFVNHHKITDMVLKLLSDTKIEEINRTSIKTEALKSFIVNELSKREIQKLIKKEFPESTKQKRKIRHSLG